MKMELKIDDRSFWEGHSSRRQSSSVWHAATQSSTNQIPSTAQQHKKAEMVKMAGVILGRSFKSRRLSSSVWHAATQSSPNTRHQIENVHIEYPGYLWKRTLPVCPKQALRKSCFSSVVSSWEKKMAVLLLQNKASQESFVLCIRMKERRIQQTCRRSLILGLDNAMDSLLDPRWQNQGSELCMLIILCPKHNQQEICRTKMYYRLLTNAHKSLSIR